MTSAAAVAVCGLVLSIGLAGCPGAADLETVSRFDVLAGSGPAAGGSSTGGADPTGGTGGTSCAQPVPDEATVGCEYVAALGRPMQPGACVRGGCHDRSTASVGLDLTPNDELISRILNVPARFEGINCSLTMPCDPRVTPPACDACAMCPLDAHLLDKTNPENSWIIRKLDGYDTSMANGYVNIGCGNAMPYTPGHMGFDDRRRDCLKLFFMKLAEIGEPCTPAGGT